jgi:uncharacterized membrane protein HdeD (DUF308 family)
MVDPYGAALLEAAALKTFRRLALVGGATSVIMGLILLIWPAQTLLVLAALIGVWLVIIGIVRVVEALLTTGLAVRLRALTAAIGLVYLIIGITCLRNLYGSIRVLAVAIGLVWIIGGVVEVVTGISHRAHGWAKVSPILLGLLSVAAGLAVFFWPGITVGIMVLIAGFWLLAVGIIQLILAFTVGRAADRALPGI